MMDYFLKAREVLKHIVPWDEDEIRDDLKKDYEKLKVDKKTYTMKNGFTLKKLEQKLLEILNEDSNKKNFKKAKIIVDKNYKAVADMYYYFEAEKKWEKSTLEFENTIILSNEDEQKLEGAPPLEYDFTL